MNDCDKIGKSAIGYIIRARNKVQCFLTFAIFKLCINSNAQIIFFALKMQINPFLEAHDLLNKAHKTGAHFSNSEKRHRELCSY